MRELPMSEVSDRMLIDVVNDSDVVIGSIERKDVFAAKANFRVVHVFIFDDQGHLLLQQIPGQGKRNPGHWGSSVAGYVFTRETYEDAAVRRLEQELGVKNAMLRLVGKTSMEDEGCRKFITLYTVQLNGPFTLDLTHISKLEFLSTGTIATMMGEDKRQFTPTFIHLFRFLGVALT
jgi:isopentenyldiphosphate isomerase